ncbi:hypothetical protein [Klebsiella aerogenes EA1509E]|nr:hypothetical protein [Klebsiella aerogenes EA1509E]
MHSSSGKVSYVSGSSINYQPVGTSESDVSPGKNDNAYLG